MSREPGNQQRRLAVSRVVVVEYVSLDGVVQAPGHPAEDPEGGFEQGGWTGPFMEEHRRYMREVVLGSGKRLFAEGAPPTTLRLVDTRATPGGLVILTYEPQRT